jgi:hypothetical protein
MFSRRNWDSPNPSLASECAPPPRTGGEGGTLACGWGVGGVLIPTTGEKAYHSAYSVMVGYRKREKSMVKNWERSRKHLPAEHLRFISVCLNMEADLMQLRWVVVM